MIAGRFTCARAADSDLSGIPATIAGVTRDGLLVLLFADKSILEIDPDDLRIIRK